MTPKTTERQIPISLVETWIAILREPLHGCKVMPEGNPDVWESVKDPFERGYLHDRDIVIAFLEDEIRSIQAKSDQERSA